MLKYVPIGMRYITYPSPIKIKSSYLSPMSMRKRYTNIPLPEELAGQIEGVIETAELGYKTKSEFVKEAVREKLMGLCGFESFKKKK